MHGCKGVQRYEFKEFSASATFFRFSTLVVASTFFFFAQKSGASEIQTLKAPQFPELPQERLRPDRSAVSVKIVKKDGSVIDLDFKAIAYPFHGGRDGVAVFIDLRPETQNDIQLPKSEMLNRKTGRLSILTHTPNVNFLGMTDSYLVSIEPTEPWIKTDSRCKQAGLSFHMDRMSGITPLFLRFECAPVANAAGVFDIQLIYPKNLSQFTSIDTLTNQASTTRTEATGNGPSAMKWRIRIPSLKNSGDKVVISKFILSEPRLKMLPVAFEISYGEPGPSWNFDAGLGISYLDYREPNPLAQLSITQLALTGKISGSYALVRDKWLIAGNLFSTLYPYILKRDPAGIPASYYAGFNMRLGYVLPPRFRLLGARISFFGGWYIWTTLGQTEYGVTSLAGPQFFAVLRFPSSKNLNHFAYVKLSPIAKSITQIRASNLEWAIGGGIGFQAFKRPMVWTLDVAKIQATDEETANRFSLFSTTTGISVPF